MRCAPSPHQLRGAPDFVRTDPAGLVRTKSVFADLVRTKSVISLELRGPHQPHPSENWGEGRTNSVKGKRGWEVCGGRTNPSFRELREGRANSVKGKRGWESRGGRTNPVLPKTEGGTHQLRKGEARLGE